MKQCAWYVGHAREVVGHKLSKAQGERILWHVLHYLQYEYPMASEYVELTTSTGRWLAIQQIKQLLGVSVA